MNLFARPCHNLVSLFFLPYSDRGLILFQVPFLCLPAFLLRTQYRSLLKYLIADGKIGLL